MNSRPAQILCVDDDPAILKVRKLLLASAGYSVLTALSGDEALRLLAGGAEVDLVILDYLMPGMNGDELARKLRERSPTLRLVAVSAIEELPPALLNLVDRHTLKGKDPHTLLSLVSALLARSESEPGPANAPGPKTILCVEDEQLQLELRRLLFESVGFVVVPARSAQAALEAFRSQPVDAVVMDYWLCGQNGTAVAEEMKRLRPRIPIVMLSGFSSLPGEGAMVDAWLRQSEVQPEELVSAVRRLIDRNSDARNSDARNSDARNSDARSSDDGNSDLQPTSAS
jgi:CheY-like chemotaxis protein